ncbi:MULTISPECIES: ATP-binding cassette domain-containing protein [Roseobacteraceae]|uniref:ATP-binding cassette domain-containing protein n=1 Tax=Roseobacteraceae TaxID=2854170 RepID=UPI003297DD6D
MMTSAHPNRSSPVPPPASSLPSDIAHWDYDALLDGLQTGAISGLPVDPQDARLLLGLLEKLGWAPDAGRLAGAMPYLINQLDLTTLREVMRNLGYTCRVQRLKAHQIPKDIAVGLVVGDDNRLWSLDTTSLDQNEQSLRPAVGTTNAEYRTLQRMQRYDFVDFAPSTAPLANERAALRASFTFETFMRFAPDLRLALVLTLISGILTVAFSIMVIFLFDLVVSGQQPRAIAALILAGGALFLLDLSLRALKARLLGRIAGRFEFILGGALFDKLLKLPRKMIDQAPISEQSVRLRELEGLRDVFAGPFTIVALELPVTLIIVMAIAFLSPPLALVLFGLVALFLVAGTCLIPTLTKRAGALAKARNALTQHQMELIQKREFIARNGLAWPWMDKSRRAISNVVTARFRLTRAAASLEALSYLFMPLAATSVIFIGAERAISGALTGGQLVAVTMLTWRAVAPIQQGLLILPKTRDLMRLFRQIDTMMRFAEEERLPDIEKQNQQVLSLSASNVFLRGPQAHVPTLAGVSLDIPGGMFVSVSGASGSGKSALLGVLSGQIQPQAGRVRLGTLNLAEMSNAAVGSRIMLIPQRPLLIYGSLAQNMRFVDPLVSDAHIEEILTEVGLTRLLTRLPKGIHNRIDPTIDTTLLSGGVRTAVAVAQALLKEPSVLMLDEASEDVDPAIDASIIDAVKRRRGTMTSLVVTHRPSVIRATDAVLQIADGRARLQLNTQARDQAV